MSDIEEFDELENDVEGEDCDDVYDNIHIALHNMWESVMLPYITHPVNNEILTQLDEFSFSKFEKFVLDNADIEFPVTDTTK
ncbi:MAG: hypothetical protein Faunusvirus52_3 [Faunusvirus sp.]|uniref:Uncharacterized protein n=1 Tax=Faunusvirus sp. TaxID=2487766 RepID=A0A3G4ZXZ6_9VIRU|nr:MAG: hypothetical protein Faunusvirus52_3 [Faunusvirus sp.]